MIGECQLANTRMLVAYYLHDCHRKSRVSETVCKVDAINFNEPAKRTKHVQLTIVFEPLPKDGDILPQCYMRQKLQILNPRESETTFSGASQVH